MSDFQLIDSVEPHKKNEAEDEELFKLEKIYTTNSKKEKSSFFELGDTFIVGIKYNAKKKIKGNMIISVVRKDGVRCYGTNYLKEKSSPFFWCSISCTIKHIFYLRKFISR